MGRKNEENRRSHKKKLDQKKKAKSDAVSKREEKLKLIQRVFLEKKEASTPEEAT